MSNAVHYADLNKKSKDLLSKEYVTDSLKLKIETGSKPKVTTNASLANNGSLSSDLELKTNVPLLGGRLFKVKTGSDGVATFELECDKLIPNGKINAKANTAGKDEVSVEYLKGAIAGKVSFGYPKKDFTLSTVFANGGVAAGVELSGSVTNIAEVSTDATVSYTADAGVFNLGSRKGGKDIFLSFFRSTSGNLWGGEVVFNLATKTPAFVLGGQSSVANGIIKGKVDLAKAEVSTVYVHKFSNVFSASLGATSNIVEITKANSTKIGLSFAVSD